MHLFLHLQRSTMEEKTTYRWAGKGRRDDEGRYTSVEVVSDDGADGGGSETAGTVLSRYTVGDVVVLRGSGVDGDHGECIVKLTAFFDDPSKGKCLSAVPLCDPSVLSAKLVAKAKAEHGIDLTNNVLLDLRDEAKASVAFGCVPVTRLLRPCAVQFRTTADDPDW